MRQHSMLGIAAAFANPHAGPSWNTSTPSSKTLTKVRTLNTLALITLAGNSPRELTDHESGHYVHQGLGKQKSRSGFRHLGCWKRRCRDRAQGYGHIVEDVAFNSIFQVLFFCSMHMCSSP